MTQGAKTAQVIGAGLAGLSAAIALTEAGYAVTLSEAARQAGGRCRSYRDPQLGLTIDNGNHLVLSGNHAVRDYLATIGASDRLAGPAEARFPFMDVRDGQRWELRPNAGPLPWWLFARHRRVPGTRPLDYWALARLMGATADQRIGQLVRPAGALWERLLDNFLVSALNTPAAQGSAMLAGAIVRETLAKGGHACRPLIAEPTLAAAFVDPAIAWLEARGATIRLGRRLRALEQAGDRIVALDFADGRVAMAPGEPVILAVPAWVAADLLPGLTVPDRHHAIVNAHFLATPPAGAAPITGVIGGTAEWVFAFPDRLSVTVSAADALAEQDREAVAQLLWKDVAAVHNLPPELPKWQLVTEKRATFSATPDQEKRRPEARTACDNLFLAGDWTKTGLPATIEGAIRSGRTAAALVNREP
ncbi:hydroxysqualene dehydroxylase HpnE [Sphingomonas abietis]|uniref:Hydroxysqualene dehydroxylase HpnE n=1 Tax=Sphingomonas abietis TaxID=3012344 RepID=A0ABY7NPX0_9SPHN|nr:hydroxysqualene dehydroxylase HpnE [Sphingomonas abietis]WBO23000.1 hydroxysqualene dehydroxylase HpnE [Sphingomonas abietis]